MFCLKAAPKSPGCVFYQLLMLASFLLAGFQDARERLVSDLYWIPGIVAAGLVVVLLPAMDVILLARVALIGVIAFAFTWFGFIGQADAIALTLISSDPAPYAPIPVLVATGMVALGHIGYLYLSGKAKAAAARARSPNVTSNQKIPRQLHAPTRVPPSTGPSASENPETAAQTPSARLRLRSSP